MIDVVIGVGSNYDAENYLPKAVAHLAQRFGGLTLSKVYQSSALVKENVNRSAHIFSCDSEHYYLNMAVYFQVNTDEFPAACVIEYLKEIERKLDRRIDSKEKKRITIDLDLLLYGDDPVVIGARLYPAKDELNHSFVLAPLADIVGHKRYAYGEECYAQYWQALDKNHLPLKIVNLNFAD